jgi:SSS family solute:Na+ symporter
MGGVVADALTDTVQFVLMCVTLSIAAAAVLGSAGGAAAVWERLPSSYLDPMGTYPAGVLIVFASSALSAMVEPAFYQRIFAAVSYRAVLTALLIGIVLWAAFDWVVTIVGMAAVARGMDVEPRYALLTLTLEVLPRGLDGLFVAGVLACAMSTIDSYLLIAGGNIAYDIYRPLARRALSDQQLIRLTRWMIGVAALITIVFALFFQTIVSAWIFMTTILIATALVPIMAALYLPRTATAAAGFAASLTGFLVSLAYYAAVYALGAFDAERATQILRMELGARTIELWQEYALLLALPASVMAYALGSIFGRRRAT